MYTSGSSGIQRNGKAVTVKASGAEGTSTTHPAFSTDGFGTLLVTVAVTAKTGTNPTLSVVVEGSEDGNGNWFTLGTIGSDGYAAGSVSSTPANFTVAATTRAALTATPFVRTRSVIGGTASPTFTYSVTAAVS